MEDEATEAATKALNMRCTLDYLVNFERSPCKYTLHEVKIVEANSSKAGALLNARGKENFYLHAFKVGQSPCAIHGCHDVMSTYGFMTFGGSNLIVIAACSKHSHLKKTPRTQIKLDQVYANFYLKLEYLQENVDDGTYTLVGPIAEMVSNAML